MLIKFDYPVRMCIICKNRLPKSSLFRYQVKQGKIISFSGAGRSFYICESCLDENQKKTKKVLCSRFDVDLQEDYCTRKLKEIATDGR